MLSSLGTSFFVSHTFVNKFGEKGWIDYELAPLCVVSGGRLSGNGLFQRPARLPIADIRGYRWNVR
jgi:hypothetical protein